MVIVTQTSLLRSHLARLIYLTKFAYDRKLHVGYIIQVKLSALFCSFHVFISIIVFHLVFPTTDGQVYTFGSNSYGQLGVARDLPSCGSPTLVQITTSSLN